MAFDEAKFRKLAAENGYSDDEIEAHIGQLTNKATGQIFGAASDKAAQEAKQSAADAGIPMPGVTGADNRSNLEKMFDLATSPLGTAAIGLLGVGVGAAAKKGLGSRKIGQQPTPEKIEPVLITPKEITEAANPVDKIKQIKERVEQGKAAGIGVKPPLEPVVNVPATAAPEIPVQPPAPAAPAIADAVATGQSPAQAIQMDVAKQIEALPVTQETGVKKRAAKTPVSFKSAEKLPEGVSFRADLGPGDNWLYNTYGAEGRKAILGQFNEGKPAVSYERAKELSQMVQQGRTGPVIPRDIAKERGIAPPETNYGKLGKAVKVAGAAGLALTAAQMAQAAQQAQKGDYSGAREFGFNLLGMIPGLGTAFNLGTYAPELGAGEQEELAKRWKKGSSVKAQPTID